MVLQFEVEAAGEEVAQSGAERDSRGALAPQQRLLDDPVAAAGERDQAGGAAVEIVEPHSRVALAAAQLGGRDQPGEVPEARFVGGDEDEARAVGGDLFRGPGRTAGPNGLGGVGLQRQLCPAQGRERRPGGGLGEAYGVPIGQRDPAQPQPPAVLDQLLRV